MKAQPGARRWSVIGVVVALAAFLTLVAVLLVVNWDDVQLGSLGEWVAGLGALVPLVFWGVDRRARIRAEAELKNERRRAQIRGVQWRETTFDGGIRPDDTRTWILWNDSDAPLRSATMWGRAYAHHPHPKSWQQVQSVQNGPIGKGERRTYILPESSANLLRNFCFQVRDADGVSWVIDGLQRHLETDRLNDAFRDPDVWP